MSIRFWTADPHYNHANIVRYTNRPQLKSGDLDAQGNWVSPDIAFRRAEEMNTMLMREANMRIKPDDTCVCVGDFSCRGGEKGVQGLHIKPADLLAKLNGTWVIIGGNHDDNNGVKTVGEFMACEIAKYRVGVQHHPLMDETGYLRWKQKYVIHSGHLWTPPEWSRSREFRTLEYCRSMFDFVICGHVHNAWHTRKIAGVWHVNVGVDVNRYMPINDVEVTQLYERAVRAEDMRGQ